MGSKDQACILGIRRDWVPRCLCYVVVRLGEQTKAVVPIAVFLFLFAVIVFHQQLQYVSSVLIGLLAVILGLLFFLEGLTFGLMPLGELVGQKLKPKVALWVVIVVAFILGVVVTFAEPAIGALQTLGSLVDPKQQPYLSLLLSKWDFRLVLFVGLGVGAAAMVGTLRFYYFWPMKPLIYVSLVPTIILSCILTWTMPQLQMVVGLAWDCGAITTGPVTVPLVLALGMGAAQTSQTTAQVSGFGIVTLASLFPIVAVQLLAMLAFVTVDKTGLEAVVISVGSPKFGEDPIDKIFLDQFLLTLRAIVPLVLFLVLILKFVIRESLPEIPLSPVLLNTDYSVCGINCIRPFAQHMTQTSHDEDDEIGTQNSVNLTDLTRVRSDQAEDHGNLDELSGDPLDDEILEELDIDEGNERVNSNWGATKATPMKIDRYLLFIGIGLASIGMFVFNIGLTLGLISLGNQIGGIVPGAFQELDSLPNSPRFSYGLGVFIALGFGWLVGLLATLAEPALFVMGLKVDSITHGQFTKSTLVFSVAFGVACGIALGLARILLGWPLIYMILPSYFIAVFLTIFSSETVTCIAWDSAGVTTGPVTVPLVLALGLGFGNALKSPEGFGILTMASVCPIISVLLSGLILRLVFHRKV